MFLLLCVFIQKKKQYLYDYCFPLIPYERAGIRTPDNLIKSQVLYRLSYTPSLNYYIFVFDWASWIRTNDCRSQSPVPYRLAIAH